MAFLYLNLIMVALVMALGFLIVLALRSMGSGRGLALPSFRLDFRLPALRFRSPDLVADANDRTASRLRRLADREAVLNESRQGTVAVASPLEETLRSLEQSFNSFEAGRISLATFRSILLAEKQGLEGRRAAFSGQQQAAGDGDAAVEDKEALALIGQAAEAVDWCLAWAVEVGAGREAA